MEKMKEVHVCLWGLNLKHAPVTSEKMVNIFSHAPNNLAGKLWEGLQLGNHEHS